MTKQFFWIYQVVRSFRYHFLYTNFGWVSHCPHSPTCGTLFWRGFSEGNLKTCLKGVSQLTKCY